MTEFLVFRKVIGEILDNVKISSKNAVKVQGDIIPGKNIDLKISLDDIDLNFSELTQVSSAEVEVQNIKTREVENVKFEKMGDSILAASMPTNSPQSQFHYDVLILIVLFALSMFATQKIMMAANNTAAQDPTQAQMQKMMGTMMPIMIIFMFIIAPIPAGVLLYLVVSNIFQIIQTILINKQLEAEDNKK